MGYGTIAKHLQMNPHTIASHYQMKANLLNLPPKDKTYRGAIQGRKQLEIKQYILMNPTATLNDIREGCNLNVTIATIGKYLKRFGMPRKVAKKKIVVQVNYK
jgi:predicted transcriptional regulator